MEVSELAPKGNGRVGTLVGAFQTRCGKPERFVERLKVVLSDEGRMGQ
jgi:hypothetical protein